MQAFTWYFFSWQDGIEILFFAYCFYKLSTWLAHDRTQHLLKSLYAYCSLLVITYLCELSTIRSVLFTFFPVTIIIYILFHQETLQRNFVTYQQPVKDPDNQEWLDQLIQRSLVMINHKKSMRIIIECKDDLALFLNCSQITNMPFNIATFDLLLSSPLYLGHHFVWIKSSGIIQGYNAFWQRSSTQLQQPTDILQEWSYQALWYTQKTDAIIFEIDPHSYSYTLFFHGKKLTELTIHQAHKALAQYLKNAIDDFKGTHYAHNRKHTFTEKHT